MVGKIAVFKWNYQVQVQCMKYEVGNTKYNIHIETKKGLQMPAPLFYWFQWLFGSV
jgi:hypothetical protein